MVFEPESGEFLLEGRSIPENALELYSPILQWCKEYVKHAAPHTHLEFKLSYFNSSSTEYLLELFNTLKSVQQSDKSFTCRWYREADDEDMEQIAYDFMAMTGLEFEIEVVQPAEDDE